MKKYILTFVFIISACSYLVAQDKVDIFGYFESQMIGVTIKGNFYQFSANKLRLDLESKPYKNISFAANLNYITYHGKTEWHVLEFLTADVTSQIPPGREDSYVILLSNRNYLDNAYLKLSLKYFDLTVGKQQISQGEGYVWNPTDVFNMRDILDPAYEQPGHKALRMDFHMGSDYSLSAIYSPGNNWKDSAKVILFNGKISRIDYSLIAAERIWRFHDYTRFDTENIDFLELPEKRRLLGLSVAGEFLGAEIWTEYGYNKMQDSKDYYEFVLGAEYTFDFQTLLLVEFYRNALGKKDYRQYSLNDWMRVLISEQRTVTREQIYVHIKHPITDSLDLSISNIYCISDNSLALVPTLSYNPSKNVEIMAYLNLNFGKEGKSNSVGNQGLLRARVYF